MTVSPQDDPYIIIHPRHPLPGCLAVACLQSKGKQIDDTQKDPQKKSFIARAVMSDHIPLSGGIRDILARPSVNLLRLNQNPLTIYLHHGGNRAVYFDLISDQASALIHIETEVESKLPLSAFAGARTEFNNFLDTIVKAYWMPLLITRIELFLKNEIVPICYQLFLPFNDGVALGPLGGFHQFLGFSTYDSLLREAISTNSPYYRFLCAHRLYDGVSHLRRWLRERFKDFGILNVQFPKDPLVDLQMLQELGFDDVFLNGLKTVNDLYAKFTDHRNRIAHFLLKGERNAISLSHGKIYYEYALGGAVLLHYAHTALSGLVQLFNQHLFDKISVGSILPLPSNRNAFMIKSDD